MNASSKALEEQLRAMKDDELLLFIKETVKELDDITTRLENYVSTKGEGGEGSGIDDRRGAT